MLIPQPALACGSLPWGPRPASLPRAEAGGCHRRVPAIRDAPTQEVKAKPRTGVPGGSPSHLLNSCPLAPNHSSLPLYELCPLPRIPSCPPLRDQLPDYSGHREASPQMLRTPTSSDLHLDMWTSQRMSCGCTLIPRTDRILPENTNSLVSSPLCHT